jgi:hypothetical protein
MDDALLRLASITIALIPAWPIARDIPPLRCIVGESCLCNHRSNVGLNCRAFLNSILDNNLAMTCSFALLDSQIRTVSLFCVPSNRTLQRIAYWVHYLRFFHLSCGMPLI